MSYQPLTSRNGSTYTLPYQNTGVLLAENGDILLTEDGNSLLIEKADPTNDVSLTARHTKPGRTWDDGSTWDPGVHFFDDGTTWDESGVTYDETATANWDEASGYSLPVRH